MQTEKTRNINFCHAVVIINVLINLIQKHFATGKNFSSDTLNPIQDGLCRGCSRMRGGGKKCPSLKSVTHILQWWNLAQLYLSQRKSKKYMNHVTHPWVLLTSVFFHRESANFDISRNTDIDCILIHNF